MVWFDQTLVVIEWMIESGGHASVIIFYSLKLSNQLSILRAKLDGITPQMLKMMS